MLSVFIESIWTPEMWNTMVLEDFEDGGGLKSKSIVRPVIVGIGRF